MDDLKLFTRKEIKQIPEYKQFMILVEDIGMEFGFKKCGALIMKQGKPIENNIMRYGY